MKGKGGKGRGQGRHYSPYLGIRRTALFAAGGFHPDGVPSDLLCLRGDGETGLGLEASRLGFRAVYHNMALVYHRIPCSRLTPSYPAVRSYLDGIADSYGELRANGGVTAAHEGASIASSASEAGSWLAPRAWPPAEFLHIIFRHILVWFGAVDPRELKEDAIARTIRKRMRQAHAAGFQFHQASVRARPEILEWVLRKDYWEYRLPIASGDRNCSTHGLRRSTKT
jgi:hypothetical protein